MASRTIGHCMIVTGLFLFSFFFFTWGAFAKTLTVFDVRRNIPMSPSEEIFTDYYITGGRDSGLREGMLVEVKRKFSVNDAQSNTAYGDVSIVVGTVRVIHVQNELSIARLHKLVSRKDMPILDHEAVMAGDQLDLTTASMLESEGKKAKSWWESKDASGEVKVTPQQPQQAPVVFETAQQAATPQPQSSLGASSLPPMDLPPLSGGESKKEML